MEKASISTWQAFVMLVGSTGLLNHVMIIPMLLQASGRDAWIAVLVSAGLFALWIPLLRLIHKRTGQQNLVQWVSSNYHKSLAYLIAGVLALYVLLSSAMTLKDTLVWTGTSYLPQTPVMALLILIVSICYVNSNFGISSIALTAGVLLPFVILFGFFVMTGNIPLKDYQLLRPILEHGWSPVFKGAFYSGAGFVEIVFFLLLQHRLRGPVRLRSFLILLVVFLGLTLGPLVAAVAEFGPQEAAHQRYPAFEEWRLLTVTRYIEHMDFLSIYQWLTGAFIRISLLMGMLLELFPVESKRGRTCLLLGGYVVISGLSLWPLSDMQFFQLMTRFGIPILMLVLFGISLLLVVLVLFRGHQKAV